jgi:6-pyruvoyltetrahydropterin/6-carboxytetrahydropterin synthase
MKISITRQYTWEMGHALWKHQGKCFHPHGHNYRMEVEVSGPVLDDGMVVDFSDIDDWIEPLIEGDLDHKFWMNDDDERHHGGNLHPDFDVSTHPFEPTAENLAVWFWAIWEDFSRSAHAWPGVVLERITIYETDRASATVRRS